MKNISFAYEYKMYGRITVEVPDGLTPEETIEHIKNNINDYPLPTNPSYLEDSCIVDEESVEEV